MSSGAEQGAEAEFNVAIIDFDHADPVRSAQTTPRNERSSCLGGLFVEVEAGRAWRLLLWHRAIQLARPRVELFGRELKARSLSGLLLTWERPL